MMSEANAPGITYRDRRKLVAIMYADMVGYSRLIGLDDVGTLARLRSLRQQVIDPAIEEYGGKIVQTGGDSLLIAFDSIDGAVRCAVQVQKQVPLHDVDQLPDRAIRFRVAINIGDAIADGTDLHGDAVNVVARLQAECPPGSICVSRSVHDHVHGRLGLRFEPLGSLTLKNIGRPVEAFILEEGTQPSPSVTMPDLSVAKAPRLSLVVRPFTNLSGNSDEDYLAEMIAEDVSTDLSNLPDLMVIGQASAARFKDRGVGTKQIGERLGVRYVVEGSVRKLGDVIRVSAQLISTETSSAVWAGRFDQSVQDLALGQEEIASRVAEVLGAQMYYAESARSLRERPDNPDAADLFMRGYSLWRKGADAHRAEASALFEQALELDPKSTSAICALADELINSFVMPEYHNRGDENLLERTRPLVAAAAAIEPHSQRGMRAQANLLRAQGRWDEAGALYQTILEIYPNGLSSYRLLGFTKMALGQAEEAIQLLQRSIRLDPLTPFNRASIQRIGNGLLLLGRDEEAIEWLQRAIAAGGSAPPPWRAQCNLFLASAFALTGQSDKARTAIAQANRLWPFATVRSLPPTMTPRGIPHPLYLEQMRHVQEGFRLAGLRDHAEEEADSGVAPVGGLQTDLVAPTPRDVPGVKTIRTAELGELLAQTTPLLIDVALDSWGYSLPGAVGLQGIGHGAAFSEALQARFARKIHSLTDGDKTKPIVVFCVNSERFTGYNAALRLAALGYTDVRWYRGGVEAWEVNGLPESALVLQAW